MIETDALDVYIDGRLVPAAEATVSVFDSGLNFADGVFEGIRVYAGGVFRLEEHIRRLCDSAKAFRLDVGMSEERLQQEILGWLRHNGIHDDFHFRPIVTRGERRPPRLDPRFAAGGATLLFVGGPVAPSQLRGLRLTVSSMRRPGPDVLDPRIKSLSYGPNILARNEALARGADDALVLDGAGFIAEASAANVLTVRDGTLATPLTTACLAGITRGEAMRHAAAMGLRVIERQISVVDVLNSDEVILAGTGMELESVVEIDGHPIGDGVPGPLAAELLRRYRAGACAEGVPIG